jgi:hypothetical protein
MMASSKPAASAVPSRRSPRAPDRANTRSDAHTACPWAHAPAALRCLGASGRWTAGSSCPCARRRVGNGASAPRRGGCSSDRHSSMPLCRRTPRAQDEMKCSQ